MAIVILMAATVIIVMMMACCWRFILNFKHRMPRFILIALLISTKALTEYQSRSCSLLSLLPPLPFPLPHCLMSHSQVNLNDWRAGEPGFVELKFPY